LPSIDETLCRSTERREVGRSALQPYKCRLRGADAVAVETKEGRAEVDRNVVACAGRELAGRQLDPDDSQRERRPIGSDIFGGEHISARRRRERGDSEVVAHLDVELLGEAVAGRNLVGPRRVWAASVQDLDPVDSREPSAVDA